MAQIDAINQVINLVSLVVLLFAIVKTYRQVRSLNLLDYIIMYLKYRQTIYEEMQKNPQIRQKQLLSIAVTLLIATFWVISSLQHLMAQWNFSNLLNAITTLGLLGLFLFQTWQTKHLNENNRYLTFANHYQRRHFDDVLHIFQKKLGPHKTTPTNANGTDSTNSWNASRQKPNTTAAPLCSAMTYTRYSTTSCSYTKAASR